MTNKYALVIGNSQYDDPRLAQLTAPGKDAEDLGRILRDRDFCAFDDVRVLLNESEPVVRGAIDEFFDQKGPEDLLVLYFSGHGVRDELGALYLAVRNTNRSRLRSTAIKSDFIQEAMEQSRARRQVLILDCCNSGAFQQGTKAATGGSIGIGSAFGGYGRVILTASDSLQYAWQGDAVIGNTENSLFTHFLVEGLRGEAEVDGDGIITVDELYDYAYQQVKRATPNQTPSKFSTRQEGEIILRQITQMEQVKASPLPAPLVESMENPLAAVRLGSVQELARLLKGRNLGQARSAREALESLCVEDDSLSVRKAASDALAPILAAEHEANAQAEQQQAEAERVAAQALESVLQQKQGQIPQDQAKAGQFDENGQAAPEEAKTRDKGGGDAEPVGASKSNQQHSMDNQIRDELTARETDEAFALVQDERKFLGGDARGQAGREIAVNASRGAKKDVPEAALSHAIAASPTIKAKPWATRYLLAGTIALMGVFLLFMIGKALFPPVLPVSHDGTATTTDAKPGLPPISFSTSAPSEMPAISAIAPPVLTLTPVGAIAFQTSFSDQSDGVFRLSVPEPYKIYWNFWANNVPDFYLRADMKLGPATKPFAGGVVFRHSSNGHYRFGINNEGQFEFLVATSGEQDRRIIDWVPDQAIRPSDWNTLGIVGVGGNFEFFINGVHVASSTDPTYLSGDWGFYVATYGGDNEGFADFDNVVLEER